MRRSLLKPGEGSLHLPRNLHVLKRRVVIPAEAGIHL